MKKTSFSKSILTLWTYLSFQRKKQFFLLLLLMVLVSVAEIISIGTVFPFLAVLISPEEIVHIFSENVLSILSISSYHDLSIFLMIAFMLSVIVATILRISLLFFSTRFSFKTGSDLSEKIYKFSLFDSYENQVNRNSSELISGINAKAGNIIHTIIMPILTLISTFFMMLLVLVILFFLNSAFVLVLFLVLAIIYVAIGYFIKKKLALYSNLVSHESNKTIKLLQEGLGSIRDLLIDGNQDFFIRLYAYSEAGLRRAQGNIIILSQFPRYIIEAIGILIIVGITFYLNSSNIGVNTSIPVLGAMALGAQRLLPYFQQSYSAWTSIKGNQAILDDVIDLLQNRNAQIISKNYSSKIFFLDSIELKKISFRYRTKNQFVFKDLNLKINKGERLGLLGLSGSGKSTLLDLIMGILEPTSGDLFIDGVKISEVNLSSWHKCIAHVPQTIFLSDNSIAENIAFGKSQNEIDYERVEYVLHQVGLENLISEMPNGVHSHVGERGARLSGGQRQRLGIARALYKNPKLIIFDEATSALDTFTESTVMESIMSLGPEITTITVSHSLNALKNCTRIIDVTNFNLRN